MRKTSGYTANYNSMQQIVCRHDTSFRYIYPVAGRLRRPPEDKATLRQSPGQMARSIRSRSIFYRVEICETVSLHVHDDRPFLRFPSPPLFSRAFATVPHLNWIRRSSAASTITWWTLSALTEILREFLITVCEGFYRERVSIFHIIPRSAIYRIVGQQAIC